MAASISLLVNQRVSMRSSPMGVASPEVRPVARKMVIFSVRKPGLGKNDDELGPLFGAIAGLFFELALGGLERLFAGIDGAGGQLPQEALRGQTILPDEKNALTIVHWHHDGRAAMVHDAALDFKAAGLHGVIFRHREELGFCSFSTEEMIFMICEWLFRTRRAAARSARRVVPASLGGPSILRRAC